MKWIKRLVTAQEKASCHQSAASKDIKNRHYLEVQEAVWFSGTGLGSCVVEW